MTVTLNREGVRPCPHLIISGSCTFDDRDAWCEHRPSTQRENAFIEEHGIGEYARWHLGLDDEEDPERKGRYKFPYGDFEKVHRCGLLAAESRAGQRNTTTSSSR